MKISVHQPQYLPWLGYFDKIRKSDLFVFLDNVQYKKREFQNRNKIRTKEGWMWLTVPVITKEKYLQKISEVETDHTAGWTDEHLKGIEFNYTKSGFFHDYHGTFKDIYSQKWPKLIDINLSITNILLRIFGIKTPVEFESKLSVDTTSSQRIVDICKKLNADTYLSGAGAKDYLDVELFKANNIKIEWQDFMHPEYKQTFEGFQPYMSIIDYLFNCGTAF